MSWILIAVLIFIGLLFITLEILVIPGQGVLGIIGLILLVIGIWQTYYSFGDTAGHIVLGSSLVISVILLVYSLRANTWKRLTLKSEVDGKVNLIDADKLKLGDVGKSVSRLSPAGKALFHDEFYEVHTNGDFIDPKKDIIVISIDHNKIIVKQKD